MEHDKERSETTSPDDRSDQEPSLKRSKIFNEQTEQEAETSKTNIKTKLAIIVPFRDSDPQQKRKTHLTKFVPYMTEYLSKIPELEDFKIFIIEQSNDERKFNRGKLLNIGFILAKRDGFNTFVFHDVDLLPSESLSKWYAERPPKHTLFHIARCWDRYNTNEKYLGGIVSFSDEDFELIDGFPNIYWGWGGEDDELAKRVAKFNITVSGPPKTLPNAIEDLEDLSLKDKLSWLRKNKDSKCQIKWEVNAAHDQKRDMVRLPKWWGLHGLEGRVNVLNVDTSLSPKCDIIQVDVDWNYEENGEGHWSNKAVSPVDLPNS